MASTGSIARQHLPTGTRNRRLIVLAVMCVALTAVVGMLVSLAVACPRSLATSAPPKPSCSGS